MLQLYCVRCVSPTLSTPLPQRTVVQTTCCSINITCTYCTVFHVSSCAFSPTQDTCIYNYTVSHVSSPTLSTLLPYPLHPSTPENSSSDYVLFQAGSTVRDAVVREWEVLSGGERVGLRGYLLHYITSRPESVHMYISARL